MPLQNAFADLATEATLATRFTDAQLRASPPAVKDDFLDGEVLGAAIGTRSADVHLRGPGESGGGGILWGRTGE